ncbi:hypothetical protein ACFFRR_004607 [Megaselia abdita]
MDSLRGLVSALHLSKEAEVLFTAIKSLEKIQRKVLGGLPEITLKEVAHHDEMNDCWVVIYDRVYNVTDFLRSHPGGEWTIMDYAGRDATIAFRGTGHSKDAIAMLNDYVIGELPETERIFRTDNPCAVLLTDIPE